MSVRLQTQANRTTAVVRPSPGPVWGRSLPLSLPLVQPKPAFSPPDDRYEEEADRVMRMPEPGSRRWRVDAGEDEERLQAKLAIDQALPAVGRRAEWNDEQEEIPVQPKDPAARNSSAGPSLEARVRSLEEGGQPLPQSERAYFEPRFGHDFGSVRVHTGAEAEGEAWEIGARAFTTGRHVVFGTAQYEPGTAAGRRLLAHELTHVVQQRRSSPAGVPPIQRVSFGQFFARLFGGGTFEVSELRRYLSDLDARGDIEDRYDSDNKARAIVDAWKRGRSPYTLTPRRKILLIKEMQSGFTGDDDERAILEILERSHNAELSIIFGAGGVSPRGLNSDFHGTEWEHLQDFYRRRFRGGMARVLAGHVTPVGRAVPLGEPLPTSGRRPSVPPSGVVSGTGPGAGCGPRFAGVTFRLADQVASGVSPAARIHIPWYRGHLWLMLHGFAPVAYRPRVTIGAPSAERAREFEVGLIQNFLVDGAVFTYSTGTVLRNVWPTPIKDGAPMSSRLYDAVFAENGRGQRGILERFSGTASTVNLTLPDSPGEGACINLLDNESCHPPLRPATLRRGVVRHQFRTWVGVRHRPSGCVRALHHIDWNTNWSATVSGAGRSARCTPTSNTSNVTEADGDGSPGFIQGGYVPADYVETSKLCGS